MPQVRSLWLEDVKLLLDLDVLAAGSYRFRVATIGSATHWSFLEALGLQKIYFLLLTFMK